VTVVWPRRGRVWAPAILALAIALASGPAPDAASSRPVTLTTEDGVTLAATLYEAAQRPAPAVIFLHMQTRSREDWQMVANRLADAGIHALTLDFRGHGDSGSRAVAQPDAGAGEARLVLDVRAARAYLTGRPDLVRTGAIGAAGASIGANVAILAASTDPAIRSLALLSPGLDYRSLRVEAPFRQLGDRPVLLAAGTDDPYALRSMRTLASGGGRREALVLENAGHGTVMLGRDPKLAGALVDWFLRTLL
jgi:dienelactone hydrolase